MKRRTIGKSLAAVIVLPALFLTACAGSGTGSGAGSQGEPVAGGTLRLAGNSDVLYLDPAASYSPPDYQLHRALSRVLFAQVPGEDGESSAQIVADLAEEVPTVENGGLSEDGLTYTIKIQEGVEFDLDTPRPVVADDFVLSVKRMCNPVVPSNALMYYTDTIAGFQEFCDGFIGVPADTEAIRAYIDGNEISGVQALDAQTLQFTLNRPAADFIDILAIGAFLSPQPREYLDYLPDSPELRQNIVSTGPYRIDKYVPGESYELSRNPVWDAKLDPIRAGNVDSISIKMGQEAASVQSQIEAGTVDMMWADTVTPTAAVPALVAANDERLLIGGSGGIRPYVSINTLSPNEGGALGKREVREALNFAIDRAAVQQILGGPGLADVATQILPPEVLGGEQANVLGVPENGDQAKAKKMLADAGYPDGIKVRLLYRETEPYASIAAAMQQDLEASGFQVEMKVAQQNAFYTDYLLNTDVTAAGEWDIAIAAWSADYLAGRPYFVPLLDGRLYGDGSSDFGGWNNAEFNALVDQALEAKTPSEADELWRKADAVATKDAAIVPVTFARQPVFRASRIGGFEWLPATNNGDVTNVWINE